MIPETKLDARVAEIVDLHFDPRWGASYWLERAKTLGFDPRTNVRRVEDLMQFGPMPIDVLSQRPVEDFLPRKHLSRVSECITSETGGTTGPPKRTLFLRDDFDAAFVAPFLAAAALIGFPRDVHWLFIGPSGPHVIGKAARACATAMGSVDPFTVDFDPRWVRRLAPESLARHRYLEHVLAQAEQILRTQHVGVLFATPPVLTALAQRLDASIREAITGIHLGGMAADATFWARLTTEWFPNAVGMSGYGNSLAGMCPQIAWTPEKPPEYFPHGARLLLRVAEADAHGRGRVMFHRLDESAFLPNVIERDEAAAVTIDPAPDGFQAFGLRDPRPPSGAPEARQPGLY